MPPFSIPTGPALCAYDNALQTYALPKMQEFSALVPGSVRLGEQVFSLEYLRSVENITQQISPNSMTALVMPNTSPYYPGNGIYPGAPGQNPARPISLNFRSFEVGPLRAEAKTDTDRVLAQLDGGIGGWDYQLFALHSESTVRLDFLSGYLNRSRIVAGLAGAGGAPFLNPFADQSASGLQYLLGSQITGEMQHAKSNLDMVGAQTNRDLFRLPAGAVKTALAISYQYENASFRNNPLLAQASGSGLDASVNVAGHRDSYAATGETRIPLARGLTADIAVRYDHYSDFGATTNPKVLLSYEPLDVLTLRGSYNKGFRAPTLYDLNASHATPPSATRHDDPVLCPNGIVAPGGIPARDCNFQFATLTGGNKGLDPERSDAYSLGMDLRPLTHLELHADYWNYHLRTLIGTLAQSAIYADPVKYSSLFVRCSNADPSLLPSLPVCANASGNPIAYVVQTKLNLGDVKTDGVDISAQWSTIATRWGRLAVTYRATFVTTYKFQREPGGPYFSRKGTYFDGFPVIDYSHYAAVRWDTSTFSTELGNRYTGCYQDCNAQCSIAPHFQQRVGAYSLWDITTTFTGIPHMRITARTTNLLNRDPPFTNKNSGLGTGWDERLVDPLGRAYSLTLTYDY
jgi:iron complex outermembrane receptor protein